MFFRQRLGQKRAELHAQEQQLGRERGSLTQQFEAESNALYEATKHVRFRVYTLSDDVVVVDAADEYPAAGKLLIATFSVLDVVFLILFACERVAIEVGCSEAGGRSKQSEIAG
jgi:hypothetical protein